VVVHAAGCDKHRFTDLRGGLAVCVQQTAQWTVALVVRTAAVIDRQPDLSRIAICAYPTYIRRPVVGISP